MNDKILVVDDEESLRLTMKLKLKAAGFDVDVAEDGEAAIDKLKKQKFDAVLLDINMPRMSGIEALGIIRQQFPQTETIMLTGFADFSTAIECLKNGARDYLVKPIDTTELITRLKSLLRSKSSEQALFEVQRQYTSIFLNDMHGPLKEVHALLEKALKQKGKSEATDREKHIKEARDKCDKMMKEIQMLLDFSRTEIEKKTTDGVTINTTELAERLKKLRDSVK
ncbi:MAG TPA: response regulator [Bacteroidota bacterium]